MKELKIASDIWEIDYNIDCLYAKDMVKKYKLCSALYAFRCTSAAIVITDRINFFYMLDGDAKHGFILVRKSSFSGMFSLFHTAQHKEYKLVR